MKHNHFSQNHSDTEKQKPEGIAAPPGVTRLTKNEAEFIPSPDEVARRAYFAYENQGSFEGHDVQHWLAAEADLIAERKLTRTHGFHNQT
ncbi:MAG TPA: DUF2934 domain-containing protein [Verrucomicrobiae bacterium]|nr:DUF2934 domain-containing protein [Verrucomicrobiae bacterium]